MSTTNPTPEKKPKSDQKDKQSDSGMQFSEFDKAMSAKIAAANSTHIKKALERATDTAQRSAVKEIISTTTGATPDMLPSVDRISNPKVQEILTVHKQTQDFRSQQLETKKVENEVVSKEIDNAKKLQDMRQDLEKDRVKLDKDKVDLGTKEEEQLAQEGHEPGVSPTGLAAPAIENFQNSAASLGLIDRNTTPHQMLTMAGALRARQSLGMFTGDERIKTEASIRALANEIATKTGTPLDSILIRIKTSAAGLEAGISEEFPVRDGLFNTVNRKLTSTRSFAAQKSLTGMSMNTASAHNIEMRHRALQEKANSGAHMEDLEHQRLGESRVIEMFTNPGDGQGNVMMLGQFSDGSVQLPSAEEPGGIGFASPIYQSIISLKAAAANKDERKEAVRHQDNEISKFVKEWIAATDYGTDASYEQKLEAVAAKVDKQIKNSDIMFKTTNVRQASGVKFQVSAWREYLFKMKGALKQQLGERAISKSAERARKQKDVESGRKKFGVGAGVGAGPGHVPHSFDILKLFGGK